jgi:hypothetical protein
MSIGLDELRLGVRRLHDQLARTKRAIARREADQRDGFMHAVAQRVKVRCAN